MIDETSIPSISSELSIHMFNEGELTKVLYIKKPTGIEENGCVTITINDDISLEEKLVRIKRYIKLAHLSNDDRYEIVIKLWNSFTTNKECEKIIDGIIMYLNLDTLWRKSLL